MYKQTRILNKNTNKNYFGQIDTEFEGLDFYELVEIPDDNKNYKWDAYNSKVIEYLDRDKILNEIIMPQRKRLFDEAENLINEYRNQKALLDLGSSKINSEKMKISEAKYKKILEYMQDLRDFPEICDFNNPVLPVLPI